MSNKIFFADLYYEFGKLIKCEHGSVGSGLTQISRSNEYFYDNNILTSEKINWNETFQMAKFKFDDLGHLTDREQYRDDSFVSDAYICTEKFFYDVYGNWILRVKFHRLQNNIIYEGVLREIKY